VEAALFEIRVEALEIRQLLHTWSTPRSPEVNQEDTSLDGVQRKGFPAQVYPSYLRGFI
jgi:hypothetical protein